MLALLCGLVPVGPVAWAQTADPDETPPRPPAGLEGVIAVGMTLDYPPYEFVDHDGSPRGFNIDVLRAVAALRGLEIEIRPGLFSVITKRLRDGEVRILPSVLRSPERESWLSFSRPLLNVEYSIFVRKGTTDIASLEDLRGQTVIVEADSLMHEFVVEAGFGAEALPVSSEPEALRILNQGQFAAALVPYRQGLAVAAEYALDGVEPAGPPIHSTALCFAVRPDDAALLAELDAGLQLLRQNGGFQTIYNEYFGMTRVAPAPPPTAPTSNPVPPLFFAAFALLVATIVAHFAWRRSRGTGRKQLGGYALIEPIGAGGMGEVWLAEHVALSRPAAIKLVRMDALRGNAETTEHARIRFEREARATASLSSPHTVELYDYGQARDGSLYYAMELLHGLDLQRLVDRFGPVPPERAVHLLAQTCDSLEEAHREGLVHRDIKPANIYACQMGTAFDVVKVLDFGLVKLRADKLAKGAMNVTSQDFVTGTPICIAPELITGEPPPDHRVDLYALGCVAYWLLIAKTVFEAENAVAMAVAHATESPQRPSLRAGVVLPDDLEALVMACLAKDPQQRPQSADALARGLRACACAEEWTPDRAEAWWAEKAPEFSSSGAHSASQILKASR